MSRRKSSGADNSDMLMDTLCNTLGAVLFIAMLLAVMTFFGEPECFVPTQETVAADDPTVLENRVRELERQLRDAEKQRAVQETKNTLAQNDRENQQDEIAKLTETLTALRDEKNILREQQNEEVARLTAQKKEVDAHEKDAQKAREQLAREQAQFADAQKKMQEIQKQLAAEEKIETDIVGAPVEVNYNYETRNVTLPTLRRTKASPLYTVVKGGKIYPSQIFDKDKFEINRGMFSLDERSDSFSISIEFTPKASAGIRFGVGKSPSEEMKKWLETVKASGRFIDFHVHANSFADFVKIRDAVVAAGIECNWHPQKDDWKLILSNRGTAANQVQ